MSDDTDDNDTTDTQPTTDDTVQFNVEIPRRLHEKWKKAIRKKHSKYQGASKNEAHRMIESWADAILNDEETIGPEPTNRDVLDVVTRRFDELEDALNARTHAGDPRPSRETASKNNNLGDAGSRDFLNTTDTDESSASNTTTETDTEAETSDSSDGNGFWGAYDPDESRDTPISKDALEDVPGLDEPVINPSHIDTDNFPEGTEVNFPGDKEIRASIVAAAIRYNHDVVSTGNIVGVAKDILDNGTGYIRRAYEPLIADEFYEHPESDGGRYCTTQAALEQAEEESEWEVWEMKGALMQTLVVDSKDELDEHLNKLGVPSGVIYNRVERVAEAFEDHADDFVENETIKTDEDGVETWLELFDEFESGVRANNAELDEYLSDRPSTLNDLIVEHLEGDNGEEDSSDESGDDAVGDDMGEDSAGESETGDGESDAMERLRELNDAPVSDEPDQNPADLRPDDAEREEIVQRKRQQ